MIIAVGSTNPVKIKAVKDAAAILPEVRVVSVEAKSGVPSQPFSDEETRQGAINRARHALELVRDAELGVGLEGGVHHVDEETMSLNWCCVADRNGNIWVAGGGRYYLPEVISRELRKGREMGPIMDELIKETDVKKKQGTVGVLTNNVVTRAELYTHTVKLALGLWAGRLVYCSLK